MDMGRDDVTGRVVELEYRPVAKDFVSALRARRRVSRAMRRQVWLLGLAACCCVFVVASDLADGEMPPFPMLIGMCVFAFLLVLQPWLVGHQFQRLAERRGVIRVTVTDAGVTVATDDSSTSLQWSVQPRYRETAEGFYMFSPEKNAANFTVLPKRGLRDPADADRLRAILDAHLSRV